MRNYQPCRVCDRTHTNPASSTLCSPCGQQVRLDNLKLQEEINQLNKEIESNA